MQETGTSCTSGNGPGLFLPMGTILLSARHTRALISEDERRLVKQASQQHGPPPRNSCKFQISFMDPDNGSAPQFPGLSKSLTGSRKCAKLISTVFFYQRCLEPVGERARDETSVLYFSGRILLCSKCFPAGRKIHFIRRL